MTVKRLIIKDSIEERILANRRSLAAYRPTASTLVDGAGSIEENEAAYGDNRRRRGQRKEKALGLLFLLPLLVLLLYLLQEEEREKLRMQWKEWKEQ